MPKYRKKPIVIEAIQFKRDCFEEIRDFTNDKAINFRTEKCIGGKSYCDIDNNIVKECDYIIRVLIMNSILVNPIYLRKYMKK